MAFPVLDLCFGVVGVSVLPFYVIRLLLEDERLAAVV